MRDPDRRAGPRPVWLSAPCPSWCTRLHLASDHPEDRLHQDDGVVFPALVARLDPVTLVRHPVAVELLVRRSRGLDVRAPTWVSIGPTEGEVPTLDLVLEAIPLLRAGLP